jgi:hypothetical protein
MAFGTKYRCEFTDILGIDWKVDIQEDPDPGTITTLQASGEPLIFEWYGEDDVFDQNIMGSKMSLNIEADSDFTLSDLFTSNSLEYKVIVYRGVTVFWNGYILANNYQEPYDQAPFTVTITATDGLGLLKEFKFSGIGYTTRQITSVVFHDILDLVGITTFTEYVNIHESTMSSAVGDSPFDQSGVDPDLFAEMDCYEALETILKSFSAGIKQDQGIFVIYRYKELQDTTMYGRIYTTGTAKSATTKTPAQYLNRTTQTSNFWDYEGGTMLLIPQAKILNCNQDYGFKESILLNHNFPYAEWDTDHFNHWTNSSGTDIDPASTVYQGEDEGVVFNDTESALDHNIEQDLPIITTTDKFALQFDVGGWGPNHTAFIYARIYTNDGSGTYYHFDGSNWQGPENIGDINEFLIKTASFSGNVSYETITFTGTGIPDDGTLTVILYAAISVTTDVRGVFKNARLYFIPSDGIAVKGIAYVISNTDGQIIDKEFLLGDGYGFTHDYLQYKGALNVWSGATPLSTSKSWHTRGATENCPLIQLVTTELGIQYSRPKQLIDLPLREMHDDEFLSLTGNIQDVLNTAGVNNRKFAIANGLFNVKDREWNLVLTELI